MSDAQAATQRRSQYVDFWNNILVPKFVRWRHILVGGLTLHSERIFPSLQVEAGVTYYELRARLSFGRMFSGIVCPSGIASPTGFEPVSWP